MRTLLNLRQRRKLSKQLKARTITKKYLAIVRGIIDLDEGIINAPIAHDKRNRRKMAINEEEGKESTSYYRVLKRDKDKRFTVLEVRPKTGRTHQIRVHFSTTGHPIVGDPVYGGKKMRDHLKREVSKILSPIKRQMLHSRCLTVAHPKTKKAMSFESPLPKDMADLIEKLSAFAKT